MNGRYTYGVGDRLSKLLKAQLSIAVLVCLHNGFVNNLLKLLVLKKMSIQNEVRSFIYTNFEVVSDHHLQYQEEFTV
jgi:hypothetical protein